MIHFMLDFTVYDGHNKIYIFIHGTESHNTKYKISAEVDISGKKLMEFQLSFIIQKKTTDSDFMI